MTHAKDATPPYYHGTRADLHVGDRLAPGFASNPASHRGRAPSALHFRPGRPEPRRRALARETAIYAAAASEVRSVRSGRPGHHDDVRLPRIDRDAAQVADIETGARRAPRLASVVALKVSVASSDTQAAGCVAMNDELNRSSADGILRVLALMQADDRGCLKWLSMVHARNARPDRRASGPASSIATAPASRLSGP